MEAKYKEIDDIKLEIKRWNDEFIQEKKKNTPDEAYIKLIASIIDGLQKEKNTLLNSTNGN